MDRPQVGSDDKPQEKNMDHPYPFRVTADFGHGFEVHGAAGYCLASGFTTPERPLVGDWVALDAALRIQGIGPRKNRISRLKDGFSQPLGVNIDLAWLIEPLDREPSPNRWERFIQFANDQGLSVDLILTKLDQCADPSPWLELAAAKGLNHRLYLTSAKTGEGLEQLTNQEGQTIMLLGISGVGKSSLVNALTGSDLSEGSVRVKDHKGRHVTVVRRLIPWGKAALMDIPGLRELNWETQGMALGGLNQEFGPCRFSNCHHQSEPGCAILQALEEGRLDQESYENLKKISKEEIHLHPPRGYEKREAHKSDKRFAKQVRRIVKKKHGP